MFQKTAINAHMGASVISFVNMCQSTSQATHIDLTISDKIYKDLIQFMYQYSETNVRQFYSIY
jgi:hypothetical protein